jgi:anionic cell wall polymer biosynthesis LytR-Cps2A-Psr (LCP) family protein
MDDLGENVKTNIRPSKVVDFVRLYSKIKNTEVQNIQLEGTNDTINGAAYFIPDEESIENNSDIMNRVLRGEKVDIQAEKNLEESSDSDGTLNESDENN